MQGVHVWSASLARPVGDVSRLHDLLDHEERFRAARFHNDLDRHRFVVARATLRMLLGEYTMTAPDHVALRILPGGKPALRRESATRELHFNVSHCGDLALFALADCEVGIDVERVARHPEMERVAAHFFTPGEAAALRRLGENEQARFFCRTWVRKEAYVKATGDGFAIDPARVSVADTPANNVKLEDQDGLRRVDDHYTVHDLADVGDHLAALAVAGIIGTGEIEIRQFVQ
jgi:4'-phosphopantetheinyl transferase